MLVLTIDTSGKNGGICLARGNADSCAILASASLAGGTYSAQLVPAIQQLLALQTLALKDVEGFAVAAGPGAFTGLRVGLATIKGLAEIVDRPIAAVSVLDAVADVAQSALPAKHGLLFAALDAGRSEVFLAEYKIVDGCRSLLREMIVARPEVVAHARGQEQSGAGAVATPDDVVAQALEAGGLVAIRVAMPGAADIARLGLRKLAAGDTTPAAALDANYIRRSDAEIFSQPKP